MQTEKILSKIKIIIDYYKWFFSSNFLPFLKYFYD